MALLRYFQASDNKLPDPRGPLSRVVPASSIASANEKVKSLIDNKKHTSGRPEHYAKLSPELKAEIGKRAAEHGVAA